VVVEKNIEIPGRFFDNHYNGRSESLSEEFYRKKDTVQRVAVEPVRKVRSNCRSRKL
jgi:hypothetical protein